MTTLDSLFEEINNRGWRAHVGHTPHYYQSREIPKHIKKRPFEAYVINNEPFATYLHVFESSDGSTLIEALEKAYNLAIEKDKFKRENPPPKEEKRKR